MIIPGDHEDREPHQGHQTVVWKSEGVIIIIPGDHEDRELHQGHQQVVKDDEGLVQAEPAQPPQTLAHSN